jgi:hypothetical protein
MGFSSSSNRGSQGRPWKIHPVWRGIGCALLVLIPLMSWAAGDIFMKGGSPFPIPEELTKPVFVDVSIPNAQANMIINFFNQTLRGVTMGHFFFTAVFVFLGFGVLSLLYAIFYRMMGPPRYSQFDARPIKTRKRRL